ncbi:MULTISPECIES: DUF4153 domain-containing protein [unclassified Bacillus (in: firmicutes)]|uniref:DUF4153 domain-containing protein n=1 Tax=unclassified Bacillus (in: firmicutes) TaxID=185979 RepID=UPI0008DFEE67|nr:MULTISPECIES: DUF4173 domain-containing protein [unclassified Bacillus (in: firmicutes)]SFA80456.1 protein of unknown function [Bacillus sp. UNCCL13]SFQ70523.1 protein of unknown function [Bacillus sp. cl95]
MEIINRKNSWVFLILCFVVGAMAEISFLHGWVGISYPIFIIFFYSLFLWRFRTKQLTHHRMGTLLLVCIWLLSLTFTLFDNVLFYALNSLLLPLLICVHLVLITSPKWLEWDRLEFVQHVFKRIGGAIHYDIRCAAVLRRKMKGRMKESTYDSMRKTLLGILFSVPILFIVINLLVSTDVHFADLIGKIPNSLLSADMVETILRSLAVFVYSLIIFGFFQVLGKRNIPTRNPQIRGEKTFFDGVSILPILVLLNVTYVLYTIIQFQYFFSGSLQDGFTYAEYARRGFFELMTVTIINLSLIIFVLNYVKQNKKIMLFIRILLTLLVLFSNVMLASAFIRLYLYEEVFGFTLARVLPHSFMLFLTVIYGFTLLKIWIERVSLLRFFFLTGIVYYTLLNMANVDRFIVDQNIARYEKTARIDIYYMNSLSYTGLDGLISLYEKEPNIHGLQQLLKERQMEEYNTLESWQSYNFTKDKVVDRLEKLSFN